MKASATFYAFLVLGTIISCSDKADAPRIKVLSQDGRALLKTLSVPLEGGSFTLTAKSESSLDIFYQQSPDTQEWFKLLDVSREQDGLYKVKCSAAPLENTLDLRSGSLSFSSPEDCLGKFLNVRQGYERVWQETYQKMQDGVLVLAPGESWQSGLINGISSIKKGCIALQTRIDPATSEEDDLFPGTLLVELNGGGLFSEIERTVCQIDVPLSSSFTTSSFHRLIIYNSGLVFSSESSVILTVPASASAPVIIDNLSVYELPAGEEEIDAISDDDEYDDE